MPISSSDYKDFKFNSDLNYNLKAIKNIFKNDCILRVKEISASGLEYGLVYLDGMADSDLLNNSVVRAIVTVKAENTEESLSEYVSKQILFADEVKISTDTTEILRAILYGDSLLFIDGSAEVLIINSKGWRTRGVSEPEDEHILQGPREGFDEVALLNVALIRRKLLTPDFAVEYLRIGRRTDTLVFICYLDSLVNRKALKNLKKRIEKIDIDGILDTNYISEQIRDNRYSLFKTSGSTERPDIVAARILEGRIAVIVDGTPVVMTLPYLFSENFQSDEDYYQSFLIASVGRFLRYVCFFLSVSVPSVFLALLTFHKNLLPTSLAISIAELRGGVPFSSVTECIILILVFEILKETGLRMPQGMGHALSIVGGLVIGQSAVEAKIISAPMLIAVALSAVCGLMVPRLKAAVFYLRLISVTAAALLGLYGYMAVMLAVLIHIYSLSSFGIDYTVSMSKISSQSFKDIFWRADWSFMKLRPLFNRDLKRLKKEK